LPCASEGTINKAEVIVNNQRCVLSLAFPSAGDCHNETLVRSGRQGRGDSLRLAGKESFARLAARIVMAAGVACSMLGVSQLAQAQVCSPATTADWMVSAGSKDSLAAWVRPADCAVVTQSPPDFGWPDLSADAKYQVTLTYPDGHTKALPATINWINWTETLPAGYYAWTVQATNSSGAQTSQVRHFTVAANATAFLVPDAATLYTRATSRAHPRSLPVATYLASMISQRQTGINALTGTADAVLGVKPQAEPNSASADTNAANAHEECKRTLNASFAWVATQQTKYLTDAVIRLKNLAAWKPTGTTGYATPNMAMTAREITWTMTLAYDWLQPQLDSSTRKTVLSVLQTRTAAIYQDIIGTRSRVAIHPLDSEGQIIQTTLAAIAAVLAGDIPAAQTWLGGVVPQSANATSPWGGPEGGYANGTNQGLLDLGDSLIPFNTLRRAGGIDLGAKPWLLNWSTFITYFDPPGSPSASFGDRAELLMAENLARFSKGVTWFTPTPLGRWYISQPQLQGDDPSRLEELLAPPADFTTASFPTGTPNTAVFPTIGWTAMHSDLSNANRTSVYFKSSAYGAFTHGHADQNSFVVNAGGERLAIDSGYFDYMGSTHWLNWYKLTKAHNAITFDGGVGQTIFESGGTIDRGRLTGYTHGSDYEIVYGDATKAYGGALTAAQRALVYLTPNLILVYDNLASATSRQWEWNIHSLNQMTATSGTTAKIQQGTQSLCVTMLGGPTTGFRQSNLFSANPSGTWTAQWHGTFYSTTRLPAAEFVALLNVGCLSDTTTPTPNASKTGNVWTVNAGKKTMLITNGVITVAAAGTPAPTSAPAPVTAPAPTTAPPPVTTAPPPTTTTQTSLTLPSTGTNAIATFQSIGAYWTPGSNPGTAGCRLQYKKSIDSTWLEGLAMWYDTRNSECRGSLVQLTPGTNYDLQFSLPGQAPARQLRTSTWSEIFPIAKTVTLPPGTSSQMLNITQGGSATGYVLYTTDPTTPSVIDVANGQSNNVQINASYVIVRGLTLKGAQSNGIQISPAVHDVVIEINDISGWGRSAGTTSKFGYTLGANLDSGVFANCGSSPGSLQRVIVQRNRIHDPRYGANSWAEGHPAGPQGTSFVECGGNHVFRYNEIYSTSASGHNYNDGIGGGENYSLLGFPNADSDIYGNKISNTWDDGIESEGGNRNVRIWGNYFDQVTTGAASTTVSVGPLYIFRNVSNRFRTLEGQSTDAARDGFAKSGTDLTMGYGPGRRYVFHNTLLQAVGSGVTYTLGAGAGIYGAGSTELLNNTVSRNNILDIWKSWWNVAFNIGTNNDFDYDLYSGVPGITEAHGISGKPTFAAGNGWVSGSGGIYQLDPTSLGYDMGVRIPNFNDNFTGVAPDIGAHEAGTPPMVFGVQ
jgi:hypothetical protein